MDRLTANGAHGQGHGDPSSTPRVLSEAGGGGKPGGGEVREGSWDCIHLLRASQPMGGLADAVMLQLRVSLASPLSGTQTIYSVFFLQKLQIGINKIQRRKTELRWEEEHAPEVQCCLRGQKRWQAPHGPRGGRALPPQHLLHCRVSGEISPHYLFLFSQLYNSYFLLWGRLELLTHQSAR